jgi:hypothetical protein
MSTISNVRLWAGITVVAIAGLVLWLVPARGADEEAIGVPTSPVTIDAREAPPGEIRWELVTYPSPDGICQDWIARSVKGGSEAMLGSCDDRPTNGGFDWSLGGVELGGTWYHVINGHAPDAAKAKVTLADGSAVDSPVQNGVWLVVIPGADPADSNGFDVSKVETIDSSGAVVDDERLPSLRGFYERLNDQQESVETGLGDQR